MILSESTLKIWLELQRQLIAGLQVAYVDLHGSDLPARGLVVLYPDETTATDELALAARLAAQSRAPVTGRAMTTPDGGAPGLRIACPLQLGEHGEGAIVVEVSGPVDEQGQVIRLLKWGEAWLNLALQRSDEPPRPTTPAALVREGLAQPRAEDAITAILARLPELVGCTRVALGVSRADRVRLLGVSGIAEPATRSDRVRAVERAMQEAVETDGPIYWPADDASATEQQSLTETAGLGAVCSVPISGGLPTALVFTFEFAEDAAWDGKAPQRCADAAAVTAPVIALRRERDRGWWVRFAALLRDGLGGIPAREGGRRRLALAVVVVALVAWGLDTGRYRVSAPAVVEGAVQQAIVAPFDGYVAKAQIRAGQTVSAGDQLARLDDRELQNERRGLAAERNELADQHRQAVATLYHASARVLEAQLEQTDARLALVDDRLTRTELRAPLDGVVISGDWSRSLGMPVTRGDLLFEIAPLDAYRVAVQVSDQNIAEVADGQTGELVLSALPRNTVRLRVTEIATLAAEEATEPRFRVEAELVDRVPQLRPGMEGVAKITVGERRRWWIWTHALTDWLRLQWWRWWP